MAIDYNHQFMKFPKQPHAKTAPEPAPRKLPFRKPAGPTAKARAKKRSKAMRAAMKDTRILRRRQTYGDEPKARCFFVPLAPAWCKGWMQDPHEIVPVGAGGKRVSANRVGVCRPCHDHVQGQVGGNDLAVEWRGKADGLPPNADEPGNCWPAWNRGKS